MNYLMPEARRAVDALLGDRGRGQGDTSILFGLSGTGKTTLSADPKRRLIGDDEHCWSDAGHLQHRGRLLRQGHQPVGRERSPISSGALRFGAVLENVVFDARLARSTTPTSRSPRTRAAPTRSSTSRTPRSRASAATRRNVIFLTCDAFGVLPPVSRLTPAQAMYHFISGYTAKVAGTEDRGERAEGDVLALLRRAVPGLASGQVRRAAGRAARTHEAQTWLVNTGWTGGRYGVGSRMKLSYTRAIIDAIHSGDLADAETTRIPLFGLAVPTVPGRAAGDPVPRTPGRTRRPTTSWPRSGSRPCSRKLPAVRGRRAAGGRAGGSRP